MALQKLKKRLLLLIISSSAIIFMLIKAYEVYMLSSDVVNEIPSSSIDNRLKLELFSMLLISFLVISSISFVIAFIDKLYALLIALFPFVAYFGCEYLISGSITAFGFPWVLTIPLMYLVTVFIFELSSGQKLVSVPVLTWPKLYKTDIIYTIVAIILFAYLLSESNITYNANHIFGTSNTFLFNLINLISVNYLISGLSLLFMFIDKRIGLLLSFFPIFLQICYNFQLKGGEHLLTSLPWNYFLAPLFIILLLLIKRFEFVKKRQVV